MTTYFSRFISMTVLVFGLSLALTAPVLAQCTDDAYEENDGQSSAYALPAPNLYENMVSAYGDDDWYSINVSENDNLTVTALFTHANGDIDLSLYDSTGSIQYRLSETITDSETFTYPVSADGVLKIKVQMFTSPDGCNDYSLDIDIESNFCQDDIYEENDTKASATLVGTGTTSNLVSADGDEDWYGIDVCSGSTLTISAAFTHSLGDVDIFLYDTSDSPLGSGETATDDETIIWNSTIDGVVYLKVVNLSPDSCNDYTLDVQSSSDCLPPVANISSPAGCSYLIGIVSVIGTANDGQLSGWTLQYTGGNTHGWVNINSGTAPVINGPLADWDTTGLTPCAYTLRLTATDDDDDTTEYNQSVNIGYSADINRDGKVNMEDLALLASQWLFGTN